MTVFEQAFAVVVGTEGGLTNNPSDPGGRTKFGISQRAYPALDIAALTLDDARAIYHADYYAKIRGDDLPPPLAFLLFDGAVNCGVGRSVRWLQLALGVAQDGIIGPVTLAAAHASTPGWRVLADVVALRTMFTSNLPTWRVFGHGWSLRLARLPYQAMAISTVVA